MPEVAGRGLIIQDGRLLLVRGDGDGSFWTPPGGRAELGEDIKTCVAREVFEETGLKVSAGLLFATSEFYDEGLKFHILQMIFFCNLLDGKIQENWVDVGGPVQEARFFSLEELQTLKCFPDFLRAGEWRTLQNNNFYRGIVRKRP